MNSEFLHQRRIATGLSQGKVGELLDYSTQTISQWESGRSEPSFLIWSRYASILKVDLEGFLLSKDKKDNNYCDELSFNADKFSNNLRALRKNKGITQAYLAKEIGVNVGVIVRLEKGSSFPDSRQFVALCNYFKISFDDLYFATKIVDAKASKSFIKKVFFPIFFPIIIVIAIVGSVTGVVVSRNQRRNNYSADSSELISTIYSESSDESTNSTSSNDSSNDKQISYGLYPKNHVTDIDLIASLNALTSIDESGYYSYEGQYYEKITPTFVPGALSSGYYFDNDEQIIETYTYWFKVEPIIWDIFIENENSYTLISHMLIDGCRYSKEEDNDNNYERSLIRTFLNNEFFNKAFFLEENKPLLTEVDNSLKSTGQNVNHYICDNTFDYVYLPSAQELDYGNFWDEKNNERKRYTSEYARVKRVSVESDFTAHYWTRSPNNESKDRVLVVDPDGSIDGTFHANGNSGFTVRPMIRIKK